MNEKAAELGLTKHALRRSVGPAVRQRVVGLRHGAADHARVERRAHLVDHADARVHRATPRGARSPSAARTTCSAATDVDVRAGKTGFISKVGLLPGDAAAAAAERSAGRGRRARRALERRAASWRRRTSSTGSPRRPPTLFATQTVVAATARLQSAERLHDRLDAIRRTPAASPPRRAAASRSCRPPPSPAAARCARRTPSDSAGTRRTRRRGSGRRASRTT